MKNTLYLVVADLASKGVGGLLGLVLARFLGVVEYGLYATAIAICGLFMLLTSVGLEQELTRRGRLSKASARNALRLNIVCLILLSLVTYSLIAAFVFLSNYSAEIQVLTLVAGIALIASRFHFAFRSFWLTSGNIRPVAVAQSVGTFLILAGTILILYRNGSVLSILVLQGSLAALVLVYYLYTLPAREEVPPAIGRRSLINYFKDSIPFGLSSMIWVAYFNFDVVILSIFADEKAVGLYGGLYRIMAVSYIVGYAITNSFTPRLYQLHEAANPAAFRSTARRLVGSMCVSGIAFGLVLFFWSERLILLILGPQYSEGAIILEILGISACFRFTNFALCEIMTTTDNQGKRVRMEFLMLIINLCGNFLLIPTYGAVGAAAATLASEVVLTIMVCVFLKRKSLLRLSA